MASPSAKTASYTARDVAHLVDLSVARIRALVRAGVLDADHGPDGELRFSFQDLVFFRALKDLSGSRVPPRKMRDALRKLREHLPGNRSLSGVRIAAAGRQVVAREGNRVWNPESGQYLLDFDTRPSPSSVLSLGPRRDEAEEPVEIMAGAEDWFALGCELEDGDPGAAREAYERTLELDPVHIDAHVNLGALLHDLGKLRIAELHYRAALETDPDNGIALFNLGVVLEDQGRTDDALLSYEAALRLHPDSPDVHYNLAHLHERMGNSVASFRHLRAYRDLVRGR